MTFKQPKLKEIPARDTHILTARTMLHEARCTKHRQWGFWLLNAAGNQRRAAMRAMKPPKTLASEIEKYFGKQAGEPQLELFA